MKFLRHVPPFIASLLAAIVLLWSFDVPWSHVVVIVTEKPFQLSFSIEFGLFNCYGEICDRYTEFFTKNTTINYDFSLPMMISGAITEDMSAFPKLKPISKYAELKNSVKKTIVKKMEHPFLTATLYSFPWLLLSLLILIGSICCALCAFQQTFMFYFPYQTFLLLLSMLCLFIGIVSYISCTLHHIDGGWYDMGVIAVCAIWVVGVLSSLISIAGKDSFVYQRIPNSRNNVISIYHQTWDYIREL